MTTLTIRGRKFTVAALDPDDRGRPTWRLSGPRGADYRTFRSEVHPDRMFLVGFGGRGGFRVDPLGPVWLTDASGDLRVL